MSHSEGISSTGDDRAAESSIRVLIADDSDPIRHSLVTLLRETADIQPIGEATNGQEAVALAFELQPDVVVMDGFEATRRIKHDSPSTVVLAFSVDDDQATQRRILTAGADGFISKTSSSEQLLWGLRAMVDSA